MFLLKIKRIFWDGLYKNRSEEYAPKKEEPKIIPFAGSATKMGDAKSVGLGMKELPPPKVDPKKELTKVNIRLHNGKTINLEVNVDMKVQEIYDYVGKIAPVKGKFNFVEAGFPPKVISNLAQTVGQANLKSSTIIQKLI